MPQRAPEVGENLNNHARRIGLPPRPFLYTLDQISVLIDVATREVKLKYIFFQGRSTGVPSKDLLVAHNIAPRNEKPDWRVSEKELIRWMRRKGFRYYDRSSISG